MDVLSVVLLALAGTYAVFLLWLRSGFLTACRNSSQLSESLGGGSHGGGGAIGGNAPFVSVIVPARNEAANIVACLESIIENDYDNFEILVVDDASEDETSALARSFSLERKLTNRLQVLRLDEPSKTLATGHKKRAITEGIKASRGDIIVTTDADSIVPRLWLRSLVAHFSEGVNFVSAPVAYGDDQSIIDQAVSLEMLGLVAVGGGAITKGFPNMCNGANLGYRRQVFDRVGGFESIDHLASGDDVLLMLKVSSEEPASVRFCADPDAMVITQQAKGWREFTNQRRRWASKGLSLGSIGVIAVALMVYAFNAVLLLGVMTAFYKPVLWLPVGAAFALKMTGEGLLLHASCRQFGRLHLLRSFIPAQFVHIPYVVTIGFLGVLGSGFAWKGRELAR